MLLIYICVHLLSSLTNCVCLVIASSARDPNEGEGGPEEGLHLIQPSLKATPQLQARLRRSGAEILPQVNTSSAQDSDFCSRMSYLCCKRWLVCMSAIMKHKHCPHLLSKLCWDADRSFPHHSTEYFTSYVVYDEFYFPMPRSSKPSVYHI